MIPTTWHSGKGKIYGDSMKISGWQRPFGIKKRTARAEGFYCSESVLYIICTMVDKCHAPLVATTGCRAARVNII